MILNKKLILLFFTAIFVAHLSYSQEINPEDYKSFTHYGRLTEYAMSKKTYWLKKDYKSYQLNEKVILNLELQKETQKYKDLAQQYRYWMCCMNEKPELDPHYIQLNQIIDSALSIQNFPNKTDDIRTTIEKYNNSINLFKQLYSSYTPIIQAYYKANKSRIEVYGAFAYLPNLVAKLENTRRIYELKDFTNFLKAEFKAYELDGVYLDINTRNHIAQQAIIKGIVFEINAGNSGSYQVYEDAQKSSKNINEALIQKNRWFLKIAKNEIPAYLMMKDLFDNMYSKALKNRISDEEALAFFNDHQDIFKRPASRHMEVLNVVKIKKNERPYEVIRRFRQNGINALLPKYNIKKDLPFYTFTLASNAYPLNSSINSLVDKFRLQIKWGITYCESENKTEKYYLRVDEVFPEINKEFESAKDEIKAYCKFLKSQKAFIKQLGIQLAF